MRTNAKVLARLRAEERACRKEAARRATRAREFIGKSWYFLAATELIEAEVAKAEANGCATALRMVQGRPVEE